MEFSDSNPPPLVVRVTDFNSHEHLDRVVRSPLDIPEIETTTLMRRPTGTTKGWDW